MRAAKAAPGAARGVRDEDLGGVAGLVASPGRLDQPVPSRTPGPRLAVRCSTLALPSRSFAGASAILAQANLEEDEQDRATEPEREEDERQQLPCQDRYERRA